MGHALVAAAMPGADPVHKVSIIPRSIGALGYTMQRPTEDRFLITQDELRARMTVLMAGRAAEALIFGQVSSGAEDDLAKATEIARSMMMRFGMGETVGPVALEEKRLRWLAAPEAGARDFSEATARELDLDVRSALSQAFEEAAELLEKHRSDLVAGADMLCAKETITPDDFPPIARKPAAGRPPKDTRERNVEAAARLRKL
jgi:cell division protease FtsH